MLMVGFRGLSVDSADPIISEVRSGQVSNVVLFDYDVPSGATLRNIQSPDQLQALDRGLQLLASRPLLIAVDQEGGQITRLKPAYGFPPTLSPQSLGQMNDGHVSRANAATIASTLAEMGINLNLAPVVDLNVNPNNPIIGGLERSFSADPNVVTEQASIFIDAHHERGVLCALKHFPGHGSSRQDSHLGFVDVTETWSRRELVPFQRLSEQGKADVIMTAHIYNAGLDADYPATLSQKTITGLLRGELGYSGVVMSDDMQMGAIRQFYGFEEAIELAINAGVDIISIANNTVYDPNVGERAFLAIQEAVSAGRVAQGRIDESYERIVGLKQRLPASR